MLDVLLYNRMQGKNVCLHTKRTPTCIFILKEKNIVCMYV